MHGYCADPHRPSTLFRDFLKLYVAHSIYFYEYPYRSWECVKIYFLPDSESNSPHLVKTSGDIFGGIVTIGTGIPTPYHDDGRLQDANFSWIHVVIFIAIGDDYFNQYRSLNQLLKLLVIVADTEIKRYHPIFPSVQRS